LVREKEKRLLAAMLRAARCARVCTTVARCFHAAPNKHSHLSKAFRDARATNAPPNAACASPAGAWLRRRAACCCAAQMARRARRFGRRGRRLSGAAGLLHRHVSRARRERTALADALLLPCCHVRPLHTLSAAGAAAMLGWPAVLAGGGAAAGAWAYLSDDDTATALRRVAVATRHLVPVLVEWKLHEVRARQ
jgi:hypothetical protein